MTLHNDSRLHVTFWGTRGSISTPGRSTEKYGGNTPCVSIRHEKTRIILDAGTGIRPLGLHLAEKIKNGQAGPSFHLLLSHTHWDHIQGLPFFQVAYMEGTETVIHGSANKGEFLESLLRRQMDVDYFPVRLSDMAGVIRISEIRGESLSLGTVEVDCQEQVFHPGGSIRYRLTAGGKKVVYATDVELDRMVKGEAGDVEGDSSVDAYLDFVRGADLLIADGQYTEEEYPEKEGWGHTSIPVLLDLARKAGVKQLAVFHHDPQHSDTILDGLWKECQSKYGCGDDDGLNIFWAREGMTLAL